MKVLLWHSFHINWLSSWNVDTEMVWTLSHCSSNSHTQFHQSFLNEILPRNKLNHNERLTAKRFIFDIYNELLPRNKLNHNERLTAKRFIFDKKYVHGPCCPGWCNQSLQGNFSTLLGIVWCSVISCEIQMHCNLVINRWIFWKRVTENIAIDFAISN